MIETYKARTIPTNVWRNQTNSGKQNQEWMELKLYKIIPPSYLVVNTGLYAGNTKAVYSPQKWSSHERLGDVIINEAVREDFLTETNEQQQTSEARVDS